MNKNFIKLARSILKKNYDQHGTCESCKKFFPFFEHNITDEDIIYSLEHGYGAIKLYCLNTECCDANLIDMTEFTLYHGSGETIVSISKDDACICCNNPESKSTACVCYSWDEFQNFIDIFNLK